jgi:hypothetical protein
VSVGSLLGSLAIGSAFAAVGALFAINYRGLTTWHVRSTLTMMSGAEVVLKRVPPWSRLLRRPVEQRIAMQIRLERAIGGVFVLVGVVLATWSFAGLIASLRG